VAHSGKKSHLQNNNCLFDLTTKKQLFIVKRRKRMFERLSGARVIITEKHRLPHSSYGPLPIQRNPLSKSEDYDTRASF
jgi:hypothetical protein